MGSQLRRLLAAAVATAACTFAAAQPATAAAPQLQVSANKLIDLTTGATFVPRGVNWPSFEYACYWGYGYSNPRNATSVGPDAKGAADLASWHINTVRLPLNQDCWLGDDGLPNSDAWTQRTAEGYRQAVQDWVALLHQHDIAVVLDLHWSGPDGTVAEGQRAMADDRSAAFWASVATTFQGDPAVMFDVFNEPYSRRDGGAVTFDLTWECWLTGGCEAPLAKEGDPVDGTYPVVGMQALVDAIRGAGATQPILLAGRNYADDLGCFDYLTWTRTSPCVAPEWLTYRPTNPLTGEVDDQLVASFHSYPHGGKQCDTPRCWDDVVAAVAAQVPVVATELSQNDCNHDHVTAFMDWADQHDVGYLMWQWALFAEPIACGSSEAYGLIADTDGTPRAPLGTALKARLDALVVQAEV